MVNTKTINSTRKSISKISLDSIKDIIYASTDEQIHLRNKCILIGMAAITVIIIAIWVYRIIRNKYKLAELAKTKAIRQAKREKLTRQVEAEEAELAKTKAIRQAKREKLTRQVEAEEAELAKTKAE